MVRTGHGLTSKVSVSANLTYSTLEATFGYSFTLQPRHRAVLVAARGRVPFTTWQPSKVTLNKVRAVVLPQAEARALDLLHTKSMVQPLNQMSHPTTYNDT